MKSLEPKMLIVIFFFGTLIWGGVFGTMEKKLYDDLMSDYNKHLRPVNNVNDTVTLKVDLAMLYLEDLSEEDQVLYTSGWLRLMWNDAFMMWDPDKYGGIKQIRLPASEVWKPDLYPFNSHHFEYKFGENELLVASSDSTVHWVPPVWLATHCSVDMLDFPYDTQKCEITIGSWVHHAAMVDLVWMNEKSSPLSDFKNDHHEFDLVNIKRERNVKYYQCCPEAYVDLSLSLELKRHSSYATHLFVAPTVVISLLTPVIFLLPPESTEKVTFGVGLIISESVMLLMLVDMIPTPHPTIPNIGIYHVTNIVLIAMSLAISVLVINIWTKAGRSGHTLPGFLKQVFGGLGRVLRVRRDDFLHAEKQTTAVRKLEVMTEDGAPDDDRAEIMNDFAAAAAVADWKQMAAVIDRLCFIIFVIVVFITTFAFAH